MDSSAHYSGHTRRHGAGLWPERRGTDPDEGELKDKLNAIKNYTNVSSVPPESLMKMAKLGVAIDRWVRDKERDGWRYGPERNDEQRLHPLMVPWEELPDEQRDKDRNPMRELPRILGRVGLQIERGPVAESTPAAEVADGVPSEVVDVG